MRHSALLSLLLCIAVVFAQIPTPSMAHTGTKPEYRVLYARVAMFYTGKDLRGLKLTKEMLENNQHTFHNRPLLKGHEWNDPMACVGRITDTAVRYDKKLKDWYLEGSVIVAEDDAIMRVQRGLFYYLSIGFTIHEYKCSVNGDINCKRHPRGGNVITADGLKPVIWELTKIEGQEVSFVNVPASRNARVLSFSLSPLAKKKPSPQEKRAIFGRDPRAEK